MKIKVQISREDKVIYGFEMDSPNKSHHDVVTYLTQRFGKLYSNLGYVCPLSTITVLNKSNETLCVGSIQYDHCRHYSDLHLRPFDQKLLKSKKVG